ncbi:MAG: hypothetical protein ACTSPU_16470 [Promethearchaeota archaeon]
MNEEDKYNEELKELRKNIEEVDDKIVKLRYNYRNYKEKSKVRNTSTYTGRRCD